MSSFPDSHKKKTSEAPSLDEPIAGDNTRAVEMTLNPMHGRKFQPKTGTAKTPQDDSSKAETPAVAQSGIGGGRLAATTANQLGFASKTSGRSTKQIFGPQKVRERAFNSDLSPALPPRRHRPLSSTNPHLVAALKDRFLQDQERPFDIIFENEQGKEERHPAIDYAETKQGKFLILQRKAWQAYVVDGTVIHPEILSFDKKPFQILKARTTSIRGGNPSPTPTNESKEADPVTTNLPLEETIEVQVVTESTPTPSARSFFCGTRKRQAFSSTALFLMLGGLAYGAYWLYRYLNPDCANELILEGNPIIQSSSITLSFIKALESNATAAAQFFLSATCLAYSAAKFQEQQGRLQLNLLDGNSSSSGDFADLSLIDGDTILANFSVNPKTIACGNIRSGSLEASLEERGSVLKASAPITLVGKAPTASMDLEDISLNKTEAQAPFQPFQNFKAEALHPDVTQHTVIVNPVHPDFSFSNTEEMKSLLEEASALQIQGSLWRITASASQLSVWLPQFKAQMHGDTAPPETFRSSSLSLAWINPCLPAPSMAYLNASLQYPAFPKPFAIDDSASSLPLNVSTASGATFNPFGFEFDGSIYVNYTLVEAPGLYGSQSYPGALPSIALTPKNITGLKQDLSNYRVSINGTALPSGVGVYYLSGFKFSDPTDNRTISSPIQAIRVDNPAQPYTFPSQNVITLTPGMESFPFGSLQIGGNQYDVMQTYVSFDGLGLSIASDPNIIPVGEIGFICIKALPYCENYLKHAVKYTLPEGPSGKVSYASASLEAKGLISGLSSSNIFSFSGCNPVALPNEVFTQTKLQLNDPDRFYPFKEQGFNLTLSQKDQGRSDLFAQASVLGITTGETIAQLITGSSSVVSQFFNGIAIEIPRAWPPGFQSQWNITACAQFNAPSCEPKPMPTVCQSRILTHTVTDFPASVTALTERVLMSSGQPYFPEAYFDFSDRNPTQSNSGSFNCSITTYPAGFETLPPDLLVALSKNGTEASWPLVLIFNLSSTGTSEFLQNYAFTPPDYGTSNVDVSDTEITCDACYGDTCASVFFDRTADSSTRRLRHYAPAF